MRLIKCDICGKEITKSYQTVTDFDQFYDVCKECEKKFIVVISPCDCTAAEFMRIRATEGSGSAGQYRGFSDRKR